MEFADLGLAAAGLTVSLLGFTIAVIQIRKTRSAAERAEESAAAARNSIFQVMSVVDLTQASSQIDHLKDLHASQQWERSLDRYTPLRQSLMSTRSRLPEEHINIFDEAARQLIIMEQAVRDGLSEHSTLSSSELNRIILEIQNDLDRVRIELERIMSSMNRSTR